MSEALIVIGRIATAHGIRGGLKVKSLTENPVDLFSFSPFWIGSHKKDLWIRVSSLGPKNLFLAFLEGIEDRTSALNLRGQHVQIMRKQLPEQPGWIYYVDLQGRSVVDAQGRDLGRVEWVHDFGAGPVLEIEGTGQMFSLNEVVDPDALTLRLTY